MKSKIAFVGSFDLFHLGHLYVLNQEINNYDLIYIVICNNPKKKQSSSFKRKRKIKKILSQNKIDRLKIKIFYNSGLTTDFLKKHDINTILRGYRDQEDWIYEQDLYSQYLKTFPGLKLRLIESDEKHRNIRSSALKH